MADIDYTQYGAKPIVDYSQYGATPVQQPAQDQQQSFGERMDAGLGRFLGGAVDAPRKLGVDLLNILPGVNIPYHPLSSGPAYTTGNVLGNVGTFLGGGELLDAIRGGAEAIPAIGKVASSLGGPGAMSSLSRQALGGGIYGDITNPGDRIKGAIKGAGESVAAGALPYAGNLVNLFKPEAHAQSILDSLGGGKSIESNQQSLAQDIQNSYNKQKSTGSALYDPVFDNLGNNNLYNSGINDTYSSIAEKAQPHYDPDTNDVHDAFVQNPTLQNAHQLQSQLGYNIRQLESAKAKGNFSPASETQRQYYQRAQDAVQNDISSFLTNKDPALKNQYDAATKNWLDNVVPYTDNPALSKIATGDVTNPGNIATIFKNPEENIQKVVSDLGPDAANKIVYSQLGKNRASSSAQDLLNASKKLDDIGLGSYVTPQLKSQMDLLDAKLKAKSGLQGLGGAAAGAAMLHPLGGSIGNLPWITEALGGIAGGAVGPRLLSSAAQKLKLGPIANSIQSGIKNIYPYAANTTLANTIPGANQ